MAPICLYYLDSVFSVASKVEICVNYSFWADRSETNKEIPVKDVAAERMPVIGSAWLTLSIVIYKFFFLLFILWTFGRVNNIQDSMSRKRKSSEENERRAEFYN